jgi:hypothetical protein
MSIPGPQTGNPEIEGAYCVEVYHGWRVLIWENGAWHYEGAYPEWKAPAPVQWIGPLPERVGAPAPKIEGQDLQWTPEHIARAIEEDAPPLQPNKLPPMEFDL